MAPFCVAKRPPLAVTHSNCRVTHPGHEARHKEEDTMINARPEDMPLFTREVLKAIDALEQLIAPYDGPLFKRCNKALGLNGSRASLVWIVSRQALAAVRHEKGIPPTTFQPIADCEETVVLANCGRENLFLPLSRNVRSVEPIFTIDQLREHWNGVLFGADTKNYLLADGAAKGYLPLDVLPPDARDAEVLFNAFGSAYSWMSSKGGSEFVYWSPAYRRRLTEVMLAHMDHIESKYDTLKSRWTYFHTLNSRMIQNFAENDNADLGLQQLQIRMTQIDRRA